MRRTLVALLAVIAPACSVPQPTIGADPATPVNIEAETAPIYAAASYRFGYGVSHEVSCSMSWETSSQWGSYRLELTPPHAATLFVERESSTSFGSQKSLNSSSYDGAKFEQHFAGSAGRVGAELRLVLTRPPKECAGEDASCSAPLSLTCTPATVSVVDFDDEGRYESPVEALRCTPGYGLPFELEEAGWKGGLVFAEPRAEEQLGVHYKKWDALGAPDTEPELRFGY